MDKKNCLQCGESFFGRQDKKFCSDQCRSQYHNDRKQAPSILKEVNAVLKKNWEILTALNPEDKTKVKKETLVNNGFNFNYYTNTYTTKKGTIYYFCYDQGYLALTDELFALVKREAYV